jgi:hypothetical protein
LPLEPRLPAGDLAPPRVRTTARDVVSDGIAERIVATHKADDDGAARYSSDLNAR